MGFPFTPAYYNDQRIDCKCGFRHDLGRVSCEEIKRLHDTHDWHQPWKGSPSFSHLWECKMCKAISVDTPPAVIVDCHSRIMRLALK